MNRTREIPVETAAALVLACVSIREILDAGELTSDAKDDLTAIQPFLDRFMESA